MRRLLICSGFLGGGTAIVFTLALVAGVLFPSGTMIPGGNGMMWATRDFVNPGMVGGGVAVPVPMPAPGVVVTTTTDAGPAPIPTIEPAPDATSLP